MSTSRRITKLLLFGGSSDLWLTAGDFDACTSITDDLDGRWRAQVDLSESAENLQRPELKSKVRRRLRQSMAFDLGFFLQAYIHFFTVESRRFKKRQETEEKVFFLLQASLTQFGIGNPFPPVPSSSQEAMEWFESEFPGTYSSIHAHLSYTESADVLAVFDFSCGAYVYAAEGIHRGVNSSEQLRLSEKLIEDAQRFGVTETQLMPFLNDPKKYFDLPRELAGA